MTPDTTAASDFDCEAALAQLDDYLKRELTPELAERVRAHVEACAPCLSQMRYAERFLSLLRAPASDVRCPDPLRLRIADALRTGGGGS